MLKCMFMFVTGTDVKKIRARDEIHARSVYKRRSTSSLRSNYTLHGPDQSIKQVRTPLLRKTFTMTFKMCANLLALGLMCMLVTLSSRISEEIQQGKMLTTAVRFIHLFTFGTWLGMQFWVTFVAGE